MSITCPAGAQSGVNPRIGTAGAGQTFPAVGAPFAMTYWTPETRPGEVKCIAPYYDRDTKFYGVRGSHFISGSCMRDYGSFTVMPEAGVLRLAEAERAIEFTHEQEKLSPSGYTLDMASEGIHLAATGGTRAGMIQAKFSRGGMSWFVVANNAWRPGGETHVDLAHGEISGSNPVIRLYAGNGTPAGTRGYFVVQFDHTPVRCGTWHQEKDAKAQTSEAELTLRSGEGKGGAYCGFDLRPGETIHARMGTSFVSVDEARKNLQAEIEDWGFSALQHKTEAAWQEALGRVELRAGTDAEREVFTTALWHAMLHPRTISDADGSYPWFGEGKIVAHATGFTEYDDFSVWDTFRAVHPLLILTEPKRAADMARSLVTKGDQGGFLPIFPAWNSYTSEMVGDHAVAILYDAYTKGVGGFDPEHAFRLVLHNATTVPTGRDLVDGRGRRGMESYLRYGYIPVEDHVNDAFAPHTEEQVSRTMEYALDDALAGEFAERLGHHAEAETLRSHGGNWRNVFDPESGYVRGRHADGKWVDAVDPNKEVRWVTEATPAQETFFVLHDVPGLVKAVGGPAAFEAKLDKLFADGGYDQSNEPSHHIPYLYNWTAHPWKGQRALAEAMRTLYKDTPDGLAGNDDAGQMSAWLIFSALGFYPMTPGSVRYELGTPWVASAALHLPSGKTLEVVAKDWKAGCPYVAAVTLNGQRLSRLWLNHEEIIAGGRLEFQMSCTPDATKEGS